MEGKNNPGVLIQLGNNALGNYTVRRRTHEQMVLRKQSAGLAGLGKALGENWTGRISAGNESAYLLYWVVMRLKRTRVCIVLKY